MSSIKNFLCPTPLTRYTGSITWNLALGFVYTKASNFPDVSVFLPFCQYVFQADNNEFVPLEILFMSAYASEHATEPDHSS